MPIPGFIAKQLARPSGWFGRYVVGRTMNRATLAHNELVRQELAVIAEDRVLEVGFGGAGLLEKMCAEASRGLVAGVEVSEAMLALAAKRLRKQIAAGRVVLKRAGVEALPFGDAHFDKACTVNTTYFWPDPAAGFAELRRVLRPGGRLVVGVLSAEDMCREGLDRQGFACHSVAQLEAALANASFRVTHVRSGSDSRGAFHVLTSESAG